MTRKFTEGFDLKFSRTNRDMVDIDYWDKLNDTEKKWLEAFLEAEYNANPPKSWTVTEKKASYRRKYLARNDMFSWSRIDFNELAKADSGNRHVRVGATCE